MVTNLIEMYEEYCAECWEKNIDPTPFWRWMWED
jgi:hypothetical protein